MTTKAQLIEIEWLERSAEATVVDGGKAVTVHFNPETLGLSYSNQGGGAEQAEGTPKQYSGSGTTKLTLELIFDTSSREGEVGTEQDGDVRRETDRVNYFLRPKKQSGDAAAVPPAVRFTWGSFKFDGVLDSMDETLEYFSESGVPLRSVVRIALSRKNIEVLFNSSDATPGAAPTATARSSETARGLANRSGRGKEWKSVAAENDVDDPLRLPTGQSFTT